MRKNRSQTAKRRSNHAISGMRLSRCDCGALRLSHTACSTCGKYNGKIIIDVVARTKREQRRNKRKETDLRASGQIKDTDKEAAKA